MNAVAEFMEQRNDFIVLEKRRLGFSGLGKVANQGSGRVAASPIGIQEAGREREVGCVAVLSGPGVEIEVQVADETFAFRCVIPNCKDLDIRVPCDGFGVTRF